MRLVEGDAFNKVLLSRSERSVRGLNFFSDVEIAESPGTEDDQTIIDVNVREMPTGELSFGIGYSSAEDFTAQLSVSNDFLGRSQRLGLNLGFPIRSNAILLASPSRIFSIEMFRPALACSTLSLNIDIKMA